MHLGAPVSRKCSHYMQFNHSFGVWRKKMLEKKMYHRLQAEQPAWICSFSSYSSQPCTRKAAQGKIRRVRYLGERSRVAVAS